MVHLCARVTGGTYIHTGKTRRFLKVADGIMMLTTNVDCGVFFLHPCEILNSKCGDGF